MYDKFLCKIMVLVLKVLGVKRVMVINGGGIDEIVLYDIMYVCELKNNEILEYDLSVKDFDLFFYDLKEL